MNYTSIDIAYNILLLENEYGNFEYTKFTPIKILLMVYYAQLVSVCAYNRPIHCDKTYAFEYCSGTEELLKLFQQIGPYPFIEKYFYLFKGCVKIPKDSEEYYIIEAIWEKYRTLSSTKLMEMNYRRGSAWDVTYHDIPYSLISYKRMRQNRY